MLLTGWIVNPRSHIVNGKADHSHRMVFRTVFTGGTDCLVRIHNAVEPDSEPGFHDNHTDAITSLACSVSSP